MALYLTYVEKKLDIINFFETDILVSSYCGYIFENMEFFAYGQQLFVRLSDSFFHLKHLIG